MKKSALVLLTLFYSSTLLLSSVTPSLAVDCPQGPWYEQTPCQFYQKVKGSGTPNTEIFGERYTYAQINWIFNSLYSMVMPAGIGDAKDLLDFIKQFIPNSKSEKEKTYVPPSFQDYAKLGLPGLLVGGISESLSHPPASGIYEIKTMAAKILDYSTGVQPAFAQGYGFNQLSIVQKLWKATRDMSYLIMTVLLVASGFLIMFRVKINPQTAVSLQTMIPKLIVTMLLVTFSYAIAGLVIDLIYLVIGLFLGMLSITGVISTNLPTAMYIFTQSGFSYFFAYYIWPWAVMFLLGGIISFASLGFGAVIAIIALFGIVFFCWTLFKIWWMLVKAQLTLVFQIILGPLQIMFDLVPGQSGFSTWFRNIIANASVFAVVPIMFILNMLFWRPLLGLLNSDNAIQNEILAAISTLLNPLGKVEIGTGGSLPNLPLVNGSGAILNFVAGYVVLTMIPKVADMIRDALKVPAFKYGAAFGEALTGPYALGLRGVNIATDLGKAWTSKLGLRVPEPSAPATQTTN